MTVVEIEEKIETLSNAEFQSDQFIYDFMEAYDAPANTITRTRSGELNGSNMEGVLWKRNFHFKQAPTGKVREVLDELENNGSTTRHKARYVISTDGEEFGARDSKSGETINCQFDELGLHFGFFLPLAGIERYRIADENPVDIKATGRLAKFYDSILLDNPSWVGDEKRHALNHFMSQIVFCLFSEDTGIFPDNLFSETIKTYCEADSTQTLGVIENIFTAMSLDVPDRSDCPPYAQKFPFVNGGLFKGKPDVPRFTRGSVRYLLDAGGLDWQDINPDIFGSMIQSIAKDDERGELGMHYTSVPNILKVLDPLFLDELREEAQAAKFSRKRLQGVLKRIMKIRIFDPACGSGNFLVIAYRELRAIEIKVIGMLSEISDYSPGLWSHVELKNFYGIEFADFAAETAKLSLWITEYQMNRRYEAKFGKMSPALPLKDTNSIICKNALRINWEEVCPYVDDPEIETYIVGNPPYLGAKIQNEDQKQDVKSVFENRTKKYKNLDYVCCWFAKGCDYIKGKNAKMALVATNTITQGQHVELLWPSIIDESLEIGFAHKSFKWSNLAKQNAGVTCVIIGLRNIQKAHKKIFSSNEIRLVKNINYYLLDAPNLIVGARSKNISGLNKMSFGDMPRDGGHLILNLDEYQNIREVCPEATRFIRRLYGSQEFIKGIQRFCIWINDDQIDEARNIPFINDRLKKVEEERALSKAPSTREFAKQPHRFVQRQKSSHRAIIIPKVSSEARRYLPVGYLENDEVITDLAFAIYDGPIWLISVIASTLHKVWITTVCGKLETRIRYSNTIGWNTFPFPQISTHQQQALTKTAEGILLARDEYFDKTIAELYDPSRMAEDFPELMEAHRRNDEILEQIYREKPFESDAERLEYLFVLFTKMVHLE